MLTPKQSKVCDGIQLKKIRAGNFKEISYHQVRCPGDEQVRQTIEDIISFRAFVCNYLVYVCRKTFKAAESIQGVNFDAITRLNERGMVCESHIHNVSSVVQCLIDIGRNKPFIVLNAVYLPYNVVALVKPGKYFIQTFKAGTCPCSHKSTSLCTVFPVPIYRDSQVLYFVS